MKIYIVQWNNYNNLDECNYIIEHQEFYTRQDTALKRQADLEYRFSHDWDDDEQKVIELDEDQREEREWLYEFPVIARELKDIAPNELPDERSSI